MPCYTSLAVVLVITLLLDAHTHLMASEEPIAVINEEFQREGNGALKQTDWSAWMQNNNGERISVSSNTGWRKRLAFVGTSDQLILDGSATEEFNRGNSAVVWKQLTNLGGSLDAASLFTFSVDAQLGANMEMRFLMDIDHGAENPKGPTGNTEDGFGTQLYVSEAALTSTVPQGETRKLEITNISPRDGDIWRKLDFEKMTISESSEGGVFGSGRVHRVGIFAVLGDGVSANGQLILDNFALLINDPEVVEIPEPTFAALTSGLIAITYLIVGRRRLTKKD
ncbi:MAG: hypothetical protein AAF546_06320 [Verrucomicrobiota bacterium]